MTFPLVTDKEMLRVVNQEGFIMQRAIFHSEQETY
jgi:hypothetical protein